MQDPEEEPRLWERIRGRVTGYRRIGRLPRAVRDLLRQVGDEPITDVRVLCIPLSVYTQWFLRLFMIDPDEIARDLEIERVYHTVLWINQRYLWEKQHVIKLSRVERHFNFEDNTYTAYAQHPQHPLTIRDLVHRQHALMGDHAFTRYDALQNNCQHFVLSALASLDLELTDEQRGRIFQNTHNLNQSTYRRIEKVTARLVSLARRADVIVHGAMRPVGGDVLI